MSSIPRRAALGAGAAALLAGCTPTRGLDVLVPRSTYEATHDIAYGVDPRQKLDVYQPRARAPDAPLVLFFYGGSWTRGDRASYRFVGEALASAGIVTVVADYRLSPQVRWTGILQDCAAAVQWCFSNAPRFGASPRRVHLMGHSAGAYNVAMLALDARWLAGAGLQPRQLAGWIGIAGPYDFLPIGDADSRRAFGWPDTPPDSQPVNHVSRDAPRALLLAAGTDNVVNPRRNSEGLAARLQQAGVPVRLRVFDGLNHATAVGALAGPLRRLAPVREEVVAFVNGGDPPHG